MDEELWPPSLLRQSDTFLDERQPDFLLNACVGKQLPDNAGDYYYSEGFKSAAGVLVEKLLNGGRADFPVDIAVYPIIFLYRHHLELLLKLLVCACRQSLGELVVWPKGHSLYSLWVIVRPMIEKCLPDAHWGQNDYVDIILKEFEALDPNGEAARYMKSKSGEKHFAELKVLNIRHFADVSDRLSRYLSTLLDAAEITYAQRREWENEMMW